MKLATSVPLNISKKLSSASDPYKWEIWVETFDYF